MRVRWTGHENKNPEQRLQITLAAVVCAVGLSWLKKKALHFRSQSCQCKKYIQKYAQKTHMDFHGECSRLSVPNITTNNGHNVNVSNANVPDIRDADFHGVYVKMWSMQLNVEVSVRSATLRDWTLFIVKLLHQLWSSLTMNNSFSTPLNSSFSSRSKRGGGGEYLEIALIRTPGPLV